MEHITLTSCLLAFFGLITHVYLKFKGRKNKVSTFSVSIWIKDNLLETLFSLIFTFCALMFTDAVLYFIGIPDTQEYQLMNVIYFLAGYLNQDIVKKVGSKVKNLFK